MFVFGVRLAYTTYKITTIKKMLRFLFDQVLKKWFTLILITLLIYTSLETFVKQPLSKLWDINNGKDCPTSLWKIWFLYNNMLTNCKICLPWLSIFSSEICFILLSLPFLLVYKIKKVIGYGIFSLITFTSMILSSLILKKNGTIYEPTKLMNGQK
jgi:hypothetical protein